MTQNLPKTHNQPNLTVFSEPPKHSIFYITTLIAVSAEGEVFQFSERNSPKFDNITVLTSNFIFIFSSANGWTLEYDSQTKPKMVVALDHLIGDWACTCAQGILVTRNVFLENEGWGS